MANITVIMSRSPLETTKFGKKSARWGRMVVLKGAKVVSASYSMSVNPFTGPVRLGNKMLNLQTSGTDGIEVVRQYETLERYLTDEGTGKYVSLRARSGNPYRLITSTSKNVANTVNKSGRCLRVRNHDTKNQKGYLAGILLHEACHPGWLIGCIAPYPKSVKQFGHNHGGPSRKAMDEVYTFVSENGKSADFFVME